MLAQGTTLSCGKIRLSIHLPQAIVQSLCLNHALTSKIQSLKTKYGFTFCLNIHVPFCHVFLRWYGQMSVIFNLWASVVQDNLWRLPSYNQPCFRVQMNSVVTAKEEELPCSSVRKEGVFHFMHYCCLCPILLPCLSSLLHILWWEQACWHQHMEWLCFCNPSLAACSSRRLFPTSARSNLGFKILLKGFFPTEDIQQSSGGGTVVFLRWRRALLGMLVLVLLMCSFVSHSSVELWPPVGWAPFFPHYQSFCFFCCVKTSCQRYGFFLSAGDSGHPDQPSDQRPPALLCHHRDSYQTGTSVNMGRWWCSLGRVVEKVISMYFNRLRSHQNRLVGLVNPSQKFRHIYQCF